MCLISAVSPESTLEVGRREVDEVVSGRNWGPNRRRCTGDIQARIYRPSTQSNAQSLQLVPIERLFFYDGTVLEPVHEPASGFRSICNDVHVPFPAIPRRDTNSDRWQAPY